MRLSCTHRQNRVQKQYALLRPRCQAAVRGNGKAFDVGFQFFVDIQQRRRYADALPDGKCQTVRLPCPVIRILSENDDLDPVKRCQPECVEYIRRRRIDDLSRQTFLPDRI